MNPRITRQCHTRLLHPGGRLLCLLPGETKPRIRSSSYSKTIIIGSEVWHAAIVVSKGKQWRLKRNCRPQFAESWEPAP